MLELKKVEVLKTKNELMTEMLSNLSDEQKTLMFPPITRKNFVVRDSWFGRNQVITFTNNKGVTLEYNHDEVLKVMLPQLSISPCWIKRKYWSQSTDSPMLVRYLMKVLTPIEG
tara:strand:- start:1140 stop:1481 length:342 start_codon:yes stop_codon:yes gene_type:complete